MDTGIKIGTTEQQALVEPLAKAICDVFVTANDQGMDQDTVRVALETLRQAASVQASINSSNFNDQSRTVIVPPAGDDQS